MRRSALVAIGVETATVTGPSKRPLVRSRWPEPIAKGAVVPPATLVTISHTTWSARASGRSATFTGTVKLNSAARAGVVSSAAAAVMIARVGMGDSSGLACGLVARRLIARAVVLLAGWLVARLIAGLV